MCTYCGTNTTSGLCCHRINSGCAPQDSFRPIRSRYLSDEWGLGGALALAESPGLAPQATGVPITIESRARSPRRVLTRRCAFVPCPKLPRSRTTATAIPTRRAHRGISVARTLSPSIDWYRDARCRPAAILAHHVYQADYHPRLQKVRSEMSLPLAALRQLTPLLATRTRPSSSPSRPDRMSSSAATDQGRAISSPPSASSSAMPTRS